HMSDSLSRASPFFFKQVLQRCIIEHGISQQFFQSGVLTCCRAALPDRACWLRSCSRSRSSISHSIGSASATCARAHLSVATLADQVGGCAVLLHPLYELIRPHVFAGKQTPRAAHSFVAELL